MAGREWKSGASRPLLTRLLEMKPAGLETPLPRQPLALSHQLSWINHLCLINGTQEPLSRRLLKNDGIAGEAGTETVLEVGAPGKHLGPDEDSQHSSAEGCVLILLQRWQCVLGEWGFLPAAGCWAVSRPGTGRRLGQVACCAQPQAPPPPVGTVMTTLVSPGLMVQGGLSRLLHPVLLC